MKAYFTDVRTICSFFFLMMVVSICRGQSSQSEVKAKTPPKNLKVKSDQLEYYLPKKYLVVSAKYTLTKTVEIKKTTEKVAAVIGGKNPKPESTAVSWKKSNPKFSIIINDPVTIEEVVIPEDTIRIFDISKLGKRGRSFTFKLVSDPSGIILGVNGSQEPVVPEIIGGIMGLATNVISGVASAITKFGMADTAESTPDDDTKIQTTTQVVEIKQRIDLGVGIMKTPYLTTISPSFISEFGSAPVVEVLVTCLSSSGSNDPDPISSEGIMFRRPALAALKVTIKNNQFIKEAVTIDRIIDIPQLGSRTYVPVPIYSGKREIAITFDLNSGQLTQYELKKTSGTKASFDAINGSIKDLSGAVMELKQAQKDKKKDTSTQDQIDKLKLENDLLDQQINNAKKKKELGSN